MRYLNVSGIGRNVSNIWLGSVRFGTACPEAESFRILDRYVELGGNVVDSANVYASFLPGGAGKSETTIGKWLRQAGARDKVLISTKGGHPDLKTMNISRLSCEEIRRDLSQSLDRLGTDFVDIYWVHRDDPKVPIAEIIDCFNGLRSEGLVRAIGASNWGTARIEEARRYAREKGLTDFCASQVNFSLATTNGPDGLQGSEKAYYQDAGLLVAAFTSQAKGFFSGKYHRDIPVTTDKEKSVFKVYFNETNFGRLERATALAKQLEVTANAIALAYLFSQSFSVAAIVGSQTVAQIEDSWAAGNLTLTESQVRFLEEGGTL